jgi:transcriptional regulator with XRE-family HTH domain
MEELKRLRTNRGLTQDELAKLLGVKRTTVTQWETGTNHPRATMLVKLAKVLRCTVDALLRHKT